MTHESGSSILLNLLAVAGLVLLNGFFVAAELALVKIRGTQLDTLILKRNRRAKIARQLVQNLDAAISATQLGITLASLGLGVLVEFPLRTRRFRLPLLTLLLLRIPGALAAQAHPREIVGRLILKVPSTL